MGHLPFESLEGAEHNLTVNKFSHCTIPVHSGKYISCIDMAESNLGEGVGKSCAPPHRWKLVPVGLLLTSRAQAAQLLSPPPPPLTQHTAHILL